ncbi:hypothetical protein LINPERPRIM_LOCUS13524 [Linum perenne]
MAATVAVVQGPHPDQGTKWRSGIQSLHHGKWRLFSGDISYIRPLAAIGFDLAGVVDD